MQRFRSYVPAGVLLPLFILALATLGAAAVPTASADTPTPSASPTPTPSASPTPYPQSTITIQFVQAGEPALVTLWQPISGLTADGVPCFLAIPAIVVTVGEYVTQWPLYPDAPQPPECSKGPPTTLRFEFTGDFGTIATEFIWSGGDETFSLEFPLVTPTSSPTPPGLTPTATAASLPFLGASGSSQRGPSITALGALLVLAGVVTVSCTVRMGGRHNA